MKPKHETDVLIIGAGPVGLFSIFACGQLGMRCHVVDTLSEPGGQCLALYPEKPIYDVPGFPKVRARELVACLKEQAEPYAATFHLDTVTCGLRREAGKLIVRTTRHEEICAGAIIVAAGAGAFGPNRPPLEGLRQLEGTSVHYWVTDPEAFGGKHVVVAGGGDSAVDWAIVLSQICASLTLVHRRHKFRAAPASLTALSQLVDRGDVAVRTPFQLERLGVVDGRLEYVEIVDLDGNHERLAAEILLPFYGLSSDLSALMGFGITTAGNTIPVDPLTAATDAPGIFAVGDVASYPNKEKLLVTGFAEAATAARAAFAYAFPDRPYHFQHSTDRGAPSLEESVV